MSRSRDPRWLAFAEHVYGMCLWLYPREVRRAHGEQMRQAFRDRCRETVGGGLSAWRLFALELFPDMLCSAARANADTGLGRNERRGLIGLVFLSLLAVALLTQPRWSGTLLDGFNNVRLTWLMAREARESKRHEAVILSLAAALEDRHEPRAQALSAFLNRSLYRRESFYAYVVTPETGDSGPTELRYSDQGEAATRLAAPLLATAPDLYTLSLAVQSCAIESGCNRDLALRRLLARDPDNAFGWMLEFKRAASLGQISRMQAALDGIGHASYFENHEGPIHRDLFAAAQALAPDDAGMLADVARQARDAGYMDTEDFRHDARMHCSLPGARPGPKGRWLDTHPESRAACLHLASLLAGSNDLYSSYWGWRQLQRAGAVPAGVGEQAWRDVAWLWQQSWNLGLHRGADGRSWKPWQAESWHRLARSWQAGDGELPSLRRWLIASGQPAHAPADFRTPGI